MPRGPLDGLTIKAALSLGFGLTLGLWLITGYQFAHRIAEVERQSSSIAARHVQAQELLSSLRADVLATSGSVRDALLDPNPTADIHHRERLSRGLSDVQTTVNGYVPVLDSSAEQDRVARLRAQTDVFATAMHEVLTQESSDRTGDARALLNLIVLPRREALIQATEDLQALNRAAFIQYQADLAGLHSVAERQTWQRLGVALVLSLGIAVFATLYASRLERRLVSQLEKDARNTRALQHLSTKLISAQEEERRRIARELHDEVGQALTAIKVELSLAQRTIDGDGGSPGLLEAAHAITDGALHTVRDLSHLLHPAVLDDLGLPEAVEGYVRDFSKRFGIKADLRQDGIDARLAPEIEVAAYRMIQEALTNVAKHASATRCHVSLRRRKGIFEIMVEDDGAGFSPSELDGASARKGLGLIGMRERALQLGGFVFVDSRPGHGTWVRIELPARLRPLVNDESTVPQSRPAHLEPVDG
ncbi:MAG: ATP-binding protein [Vicinamibacterales bacterium]